MDWFISMGLGWKITLILGVMWLLSSFYFFFASMYEELVLGKKDIKAPSYRTWRGIRYNFIFWILIIPPSTIGAIIGLVVSIVEKVEKKKKEA